jgi:lipid-binding SYLF domain-containing protein
MKKVLLPLFFIFLFAAACFADEDREKVAGRVRESATVLDEIMAAPDKGIPEEVMGSAECVAIVPSLLKGGFVFGGEYGRGVATCRGPNGWSAPAFFRVGGGSFGLQIGGQAVDLVMLIMNQRGMQALLSSHFQLGADASAAAGPVGRHAEGMTDWKMRAEVLTYSRARGLFAGVTLNGAWIKQDSGDTRSFYGRNIAFSKILRGEIPAPADAQPFLSTVAKYNAAPSQAPKTSAGNPAAPAAPAVTPAPATANSPAPATETKPAAAAPSAAENPPTQSSSPPAQQTQSTPPEKPSPAIDPH